MNRYCLLDVNIIDTLHNLKQIGVNDAKINGYNIIIDSDRYDNFYEHGLKCQCCGLEASYAAIEKQAKAKHYHINFYGISEGKEIQLTRDHIYPKALGGFDILENYQTLCEKCNAKKKDKTEITLFEAIKKGYTSYEYGSLMQQINQKKEENLSLMNQLKENRRLITELTQKKILFKQRKIDKREYF